MRHLRRLAAVVSLALGLVTSASAALEPKTLVLGSADVPPGFMLDRSDSGPRSNAYEARRDRAFRGKLDDWGRLTGYEARFDGRGGGISSRADIFRSPAGARALLVHYADEMRRAGVAGLTRRAISLGAGGWAYSGSSRDTYAVVIWRYGSVFSGVIGLGLTYRELLGLARVQQRHVVSALG